MTQETVNVAEIFQMMPARFNKEAAEGIEAIYQFELTGQGGGTYQVRICLLYTSPSPRDVEESRMPSSA